MVPESDPTTLSADAADNRPSRPDEVAPRFTGWGFDWLDIPALIADSRDLLKYPMVDRDPLPHWGQGRITLLGDAAHAMYPIGANGGSQAILDGVALASSLATHHDRGAGLAAYEADRREATTAVVLANRRLNQVERGLLERDLDELAAAGDFTRMQDDYASGNFSAV